MRVAAALILVALAVACLQASRALACSPSVSPYPTIEAIEPADGSTGFPRNGAVGVALKLWPVTDSQDSGRVEVRVSVADGGESVEGIVNRFSPASDLATWTPNAPLRANTRYRVEVTTIAPRRPSGVDGPTTATSTFTTSDALAPQLELVGTLRVTLRQGVADLLQCGPCGQCMKIGERPALLADVELPVVQAGFDEYGYLASFTLNDRSAPMWIGPGEGKLEGNHEIGLGHLLYPTPGMHNSLTQELPEENHPYTACFGFNAWDPIGQSKSAESVCIPASEVAAAFEALAAKRSGAKTDAGSASLAGRPAAASGSAGASPSANDAGAERAAADPRDADAAPQRALAGSGATTTRDPVDPGESAKHASSGFGCSIALQDRAASTSAGVVVLFAVLRRMRRRIRRRDAR